MQPLSLGSSDEVGGKPWRGAPRAGRCPVNRKVTSLFSVGAQPGPQVQPLVGGVREAAD